MAFLIIDRRLNGKHKSAVNRQRFLRRYRKHIKEAVADVVKKRSITDIERGEGISIPKKDISEPVFRHGKGGKQQRIFPGNKEFTRGDKIKRPPGGGGGSGGGDASDSGEGIDEFIFELSQDEFLDFLFDDLELPNLVKKQLKDSDSYKIVKGGYTHEGIPARLDVVQSLRSAHARRIALGGSIRRKIKELKEELHSLETSEEELPSLETAEESTEESTDAQSMVNIDEKPITGRIRIVKEEIFRLERRLNHIPFLDDFDLRFNNVIEHPLPTTSAVMFCLMDVSGSMTEEIKEIAKRFYILLYMFLKRNYKRIEVVFIRHHTSATEVDEEEFFYSRETGGTIVSSALHLMAEIIQDRYPTNDWNIYAAQASDGDNWSDDSSHCSELLQKKILPLLQYYSYVEIKATSHQELWHCYESIAEEFKDNFAMYPIESVADIYPVFRQLFERKAR